MMIIKLSLSCVKCSLGIMHLMHFMYKIWISIKRYTQYVYIKWIQKSYEKHNCEKHELQKSKSKMSGCIIVISIWGGGHLTVSQVKICLIFSKQNIIEY